MISKMTVYAFIQTSQSAVPFPLLCEEPILFDLYIFSFDSIW